MAKKILSVFLTAILIVSLTACAGGGNQSSSEQTPSEPTASSTPAASASGSQAEGAKEIVEITYWHEDADTIRTAMMEEIIGWANEKSAETGVKIIYEGFPSSNAYDKISVAIAGASTPDIGGIWGSWSTDFILQGALYDITDYFEAWDEKDQYDPTAIATILKSDITNGRLYALPYTTTSDGNALWYRADRYAEYGVTPPQTWDEFFSAVEKTTFLDKNEYGFSIRGGVGAGKQLNVMMYAYSGAESFFNDDGTSFLRTHMDSLAAFVERYAGMYKTFTPEDDLTAGNKEMVAAFDSGIANMIQHNLLSEAEHKVIMEAGQYQAIPLPVSQQGWRTLQNPAVNSYTMYATTKNPDAAWIALTQLASKEGIAKYQEVCGEVPPRLDVQQMDQVKNNPNISSLVDAMTDPTTKFVMTPNYLPEYKTIESQILNPGFQAVLTGEKTGVEFITELADAFEASYKSYTDVYGNALK